MSSSRSNSSGRRVGVAVVVVVVVVVIAVCGVGVGVEEGGARVGVGVAGALSSGGGSSSILLLRIIMSSLPGQADRSKSGMAAFCSIPFVLSFADHGSRHGQPGGVYRGAQQQGAPATPGWGCVRFLAQLV